jgi:hypothetical protein
VLSCHGRTDLSFRWRVPRNGVIIYTTYNLYGVKARADAAERRSGGLAHRILKAAEARWQSDGEKAERDYAVHQTRHRAWPLGVSGLVYREKKGTD